MDSENIMAWPFGVHSGYGEFIANEGPQVERHLLVVFKEETSCPILDLFDSRP